MQDIVVALGVCAGLVIAVCLYRFFTQYVFLTSNDEVDALVARSRRFDKNKNHWKIGFWSMVKPPLPHTQRDDWLFLP